MNNIHLYLSKRHGLFYGYSLLDLYQDESHCIPIVSAYSLGLLVYKTFVLFCATYKYNRNILLISNQARENYDDQNYETTISCIHSRRSGEGS